jgi:hypothetical protein
MIGREPDNRHPVLLTRATRNRCGTCPVVSEGMRRASNFYTSGINWIVTPHHRSSPTAAMAWQVASFGFTGSVRLSAEVLLLEVMVRASCRPNTRYASTEMGFEADLHLAADWSLLRDPVSSLPTSCGCHISTVPDYLVGGVRAPLRMSLAVHPGLYPVGVIVGPDFVWVFSVDNVVMDGIASVQERVAWLYCFLLSVTNSFTSGQVQVCVVSSLRVSPSSPHIGFAEYLLSALEAYEGSITFAQCTGRQCSVACGYARSIIPILYTAKQWVFPDSLCRYTYTTRGRSLACQLPTSRL